MKSYTCLKLCPNGFREEELKWFIAQTHATGGEELVTTSTTSSAHAATIPKGVELRFFGQRPWGLCSHTPAKPY